MRIRTRLLIAIGCGVAVLATGACSRRRSTATSTEGAKLATGGARAILAAHSSRCLSCAEARCGQFLDMCSTLQGQAERGAAKGTPKSELCLKTVECSTRSKCADGESVEHCYCGSAPGEECLSGKANGVCKSQIEAALETTEPMGVSSTFLDHTKGGGPALELMNCLGEKKCRSCF